MTANEKPLFFGNLHDETCPKGRSVTTELRQTTLDPRLESLYEMVGLGDWEERDEIMGRMSRTRVAGKCPAGHELIKGENDNGDLPRDHQNQLHVCAICNRSIHRRHVLGMVLCVECGFSLCTPCKERDAGSPAEEDPYAALEAFALNIAREFACWSCAFGGRGHMCGYPTFQLTSEYTPRMLHFGSGAGLYDDGDDEDEKEAFCIKEDTKMLHDGVRLITRFDSDVREFLMEADESTNASFLQRNCCARRELPDAAKNAEIDQCLEDGGTIQTMMDLRGAWIRPPHDIWPKLANEWSNRFWSYTTIGGDRAVPYATTKLVSYELDTVIFEVGVRIDDGDY